MNLSLNYKEICIIEVMDFSKLFKKAKKEFGSNLTMKIGHPPKMKSSSCFCLWSDLLGFSKIFVETNWELNKSQMEKIYSRLEAAHSSALYYSTPFERNLILNDGIAKVFHPKSKVEDKNNILSISIFLRSCVELHMSINETEHENGFPGSRTVLAFGENIEYLTEEVRFDDYVWNYSKPKGSEISSLANSVGNPIVIYNPKEMQMNTAFSKAYILESGGGKAGLPGNYMYIDKSVIDAIDKYARDKGYHPIWQENGDMMNYFIPYVNGDLSRVVLGFSFDKNVIHPQGIIYETEVYKLLRYYPWDEYTNEFYFNVNNPSHR